MESLNSSLFKFKIPENETESDGESLSSYNSEAEFDIESLPVEVARRIHALENLQDKRQEIEVLFRKELAVLEKKYESLYEPLYSERKKIINGDREVTEEEYKDRESSHIVEESEAASTEPVKGIPNFWYHTLLRSQLSSLVFDNDEEALKYLTDIKTERVIDNESPKLIINFEFASNPFFSNSCLTKTVFFNDAGDAVTKVTGTKIEWNSGKNLCFEIKAKKVRSRSRPDVVSTTEELVYTSSFFHFFDEIEGGCSGDHDHDHEHDEEHEEQYSRMMADAEICSFIDKFIIPNAIDWYTGKANNDLYDSDEYYSDEDDEDEEDSDY